MEFQTVDVSKLGPFAQKQLIHFSRHCNLIQGPSGSGKTTISAELMRVFKSGFTHKTVPLDQALSLCFIGEDYGYRNRKGSSVLSDSLRIAVETNSSEITDALTFYINRLFECPRSKFVATATERGDVDVCDENGSDSLFSAPAASESFIRALATNFAVRDVLGFHEPIVVDGGFGCLDDWALHTCFRAVMERSEQRIILQSQWLFGRLHARPDFNIVVNAEGFSEIGGRSA